jgi:hypothetical protein
MAVNLQDHYLEQTGTVVGDSKWRRKFNEYQRDRLPGGDQKVDLRRTYRFKRFTGGNKRKYDKNPGSVDPEGFFNISFHQIKIIDKGKSTDRKRRILEIRAQVTSRLGPYKTEIPPKLNYKLILKDPSDNKNKEVQIVNTKARGRDPANHPLTVILKLANSGQRDRRFVRKVTMELDDKYEIDSIQGVKWEFPDEDDYEYKFEKNW